MPGKSSWQIKLVLILGMIGAVTALGLPKGSPGTVQAGGPRLISVEPLPAPDGAACAWIPAGANIGLAATRQQGEGSAVVQAGAVPDEATRLAASQRKPVRMIRDPHPAYSSVAVDPIRNEVVFTDENLFQILVYDRLANTPPTAAFTEPKRTIGGAKTLLEFQCGLYIDPASGDIYSVPNDIVDTVTVLSRQAKGDVPPDRELYTPHGTFGIAVEEGAQEMYLTVEHANAVVVYDKMAQKDDAPVRLLQSDRTGLADPHGIALDTKTRLMFVANHGSVKSQRPGGTPAPTLGVGRVDGKKNWPVEDPILGSGKNVPPIHHRLCLGCPGRHSPAADD